MNCDICIHIPHGRCNVTLDSREYVVNALYVKEAYRRQGTGKRLLRLACGVISGLGGKEAVLYTEKDGAAWPHAWYLRYGFRDVPPEPEYADGYFKMVYDIHG